MKRTAGDIFFLRPVFLYGRCHAFHPGSQGLKASLLIFLNLLLLKESFHGACVGPVSFVNAENDPFYCSAPLRGCYYLSWRFLTFTWLVAIFSCEDYQVVPKWSSTCLFVAYFLNKRSICDMNWSCRIFSKRYFWGIAWPKFHSSLAHIFYLFICVKRGAGEKETSHHD